MRKERAPPPPPHHRTPGAPAVRTADTDAEAHLDAGVQAWTAPASARGWGLLVHPRAGKREGRGRVE